MGIRVRVSRSLAQHTGGVAVDPQDGIWKVEEHETREDRILCCVYAHDSCHNEAFRFRHMLGSPTADWETRPPLKKDLKTLTLIT